MSPKHAHTLRLSEALLYLAIFSMPFEGLITIAGSSVVKLIGVVFFVTSVLDWKLYYRELPVELLYFALYMIIGVLLDFSRTDLSLAVINFNIRPILLLFMMTAVYNLACAGRLRLLMICLALASFVMSLFQATSISGGVSRAARSGEYAHRVSALNMDPNFLASFVSLSTVVGAVLAFGLIKCPPRLRMLGAVSILSGLVSLVRSASRGGLLVLLFGSLALTFTAERSRVKGRILVALVLFFLALTFAVTQNDLFVQRIQMTVETGYTAHRTDIWAASWELIKESPFIGYGHRYYLHVLGPHFGADIKGTHNTYIAAVLGAGFIGAMFLFLFVVSAGRKAWRYRRSIPGAILWSWYIMCLTMGMSINAESMKSFWIILALCVSLPKALYWHRPDMFSRPPISYNYQ